MSTAYETTGRVHQKQRTKQALIDAACSLIADGQAPTVEEAAVVANVSRTTAYRYFPSQRALLAAAHPEIERTSLLPPDAGDDPAQRLGAVLGALSDIITGAEAQQRAILRLSLEANPDDHPSLELRQGRAIGWLDEALAPVRGRIPEAAFERLVLAIRASAGIESYVWLRDVAGLSPHDAVAVQHWSAQALLEATLAEHAGARDRCSEEADRGAL